MAALIRDALALLAIIGLIWAIAYWAAYLA